MSFCEIPKLLISDLLQNGLEFSPKFLKKTDVFCQFDMIVKFMTQELDDN